VRTFLLTLLLTVSSIGVLSQPTPAQRNAEGVVKIVLSRASEQMYTSSDATELNKLGDASAVALTKLLGGKELTTDEIAQVVLIIRLSFNAPRIIEADSDVQPRTTLFVLKYLDNLPVSSALKQKIAEARVEVEQASKVRH
jgi:hypothetical protein